MKKKMLILLAHCLVCVATAPAASHGRSVKYIGGTIASLPAGSVGEFEISDDNVMRFRSVKGNFEIAYDDIAWIEYGEEPSRRLRGIADRSPAPVKKRRQFVAIGFKDERNEPRGVVLEILKAPVRAMIADLEALSGVKCEQEF